MVMRRSCFASIAALSFSAALAVIPCSASAVPRYSATPLTATQGVASSATAINDAGQITLQVENRAFLYSDGRFTDLQMPVATAINSSGQVVGYGSSSAGGMHAFFYSNGTTTDLGTLGGQHAFALGLNDLGQVTGYVQGASPPRAFILSNGALSFLGTLGGNVSMGVAINAAGQVTGCSDVGFVGHAFLYSSGIMSDLGTLGGLQSCGNAINAAGQVVGSSLDASGTKDRAFLYSSGAMGDLGSLGSGPSYASALNSHGHIVGSSGFAPEDRAVLYWQGTTYDLNSLVVAGLNGATLTQATGVNASGQIVANDCTGAGQIEGGPPGRGCRAYRLDPLIQPVPTLSNFGLAATALLLLFGPLIARRSAKWRVTLPP